ncbi:MAG: hypothetical protein AABY87_04170 [bacterium]
MSKGRCSRAQEAANGRDHFLKLSRDIFEPGFPHKASPLSRLRGILTELVHEIIKVRRKLGPAV